MIWEYAGVRNSPKGKRIEAAAKHMEIYAYSRKKYNVKAPLCYKLILAVERQSTPLPEGHGSLGNF